MEFYNLADTLNAHYYNNKYYDGIRIEKEVNGITTKYYLEGTNIIYEDRDGEIIYYNYDSTGVSGLTYQNNEYYFIKNIQGDIIGILDEEFNQIVSYTYDSWGNIISITDENGNDISNNTNHIGNINPFKYRGYYYDNETNLYYLNSRYYNPEMGRFINADDIDIFLENQDHVIEYNLYIYCLNNYINMLDSNGKIAQFALAGGGILVSGGSFAGANIWNPVGWIVGGVIIGAGAYYGGKAIVKQLKKKSKQTQKERATDRPSWSRGETPKRGENGKDYAKRLMDKKYGKGNWKSSSREYGQLKKWGDRGYVSGR